VPAACLVHFLAGWWPAYTACRAQNWLLADCPYFITKDQWPPNSPNMNPMDYHVRGIPQAYNKAENNCQTQGSTSGYLEQLATRTDRQGCGRLLKLSNWKLVLELGAGGGHFEHSQW